MTDRQHVWIVHVENGSPICVCATEDLAKNILIGRENEWHVQRWEIQSGLDN